MVTTTPTVKKLRIAPGDRLALFNAPPGYAAKVRPPAPGHRDIEATPGAAANEEDRANDGALVFVRSTRDLRAARDAGMCSARRDDRHIPMGCQTVLSSRKAVMS